MINNQPIITYIFDRYRKATSIHKAVVEMRITFNRKQKYISTDIFLYPNQWRKGRVINTPDAIQLNQSLDMMLINVRQVILNMSEEGGIDIFSIPERLHKLKEAPISFIDFCTKRSNVRKYDKSPDTQERYDRFIKSFKLWGKIVTFKDITDNNIILYDNYLKGKGMKTYSIWNNYHRFLNSFIMDAIDEGYLTRNPYKWVNIIRGKHTDSINKCLTIEEFRKIKKVILPTKSLERVRDVFVFQTYTCLSYSDLKTFDTSNIKEIKNMKVYMGNRQKTHQSFVIPLIKPALEILYKYNQHLPIISNVNYNEYLKIVAQAAGIDKPISSHWARHTGATLLLNEGVPINIISKICGHSSTKITEQIYAKLFDDTIIDTLSKIQI